MRDIGIFLAKPLSTAELVDFLRSHASTRRLSWNKRADESVIGRTPDVLYVFDPTDGGDAIYSDDERRDVESRLGSTVQSYVSIHFTSTDGALDLATELAERLKQKWGGIIDYSGSGGDLEVPPKPLDD
jgi:hypothetical protein